MPAQRRSHRDLVRAMREHVAIETPQKGPVRAVVEDGATDLALARAAAATELGRPLRGREARAVRHEVAAAHAAVQPQPQRRPSIRERLEAMTPDERAEVVASMRDPEARAYVERIAEDIDIIDDAAELLAAQHDEDAWLASHDDDYEPLETEWAPGLTPAEMHAVEHESAVGDPWGSAQAAVAGEESEYSDDLEADYDLVEEEV